MKIERDDLFEVSGIQKLVASRHWVNRTGGPVQRSGLREELGGLTIWVVTKIMGLERIFSC